MEFERCAPTKVFEVNGEVCPLLTANLVGVVANDQQIVAAVTGKRIRVMGWIIQGSTAVVGGFRFISASGGTPIMGPIYVPGNGAGLTHDLPVTRSGYMETVTGEGLFVNVVTAAINFTVFYIVYKP